MGSNCKRLSNVVVFMSYSSKEAFIEWAGLVHVNMDPVVHKLLELWELDDSAFSHHSALQASNALSLNKHLSLYSEKPKEPLHHADSPPKGCTSQDGSERVWPESSTAESPVMSFCEKCRHANLEHANWCVECGTALLGSKTDKHMSTHSEVHEHEQSDDDLADLNMVDPIFTESLPSPLDRIENSTFDVKFDSLNPPDEHRLNNHDSNHQMCTNISGNGDSLVFADVFSTKQTRSMPKSPKRSAISPVMLKTHPHNRVKKFCNSTTINKSTSQLVTKKEYQRYWNTSGAYMWRKPCSIQKSSICPANDTRHDNQTQPGDLYTPGYENPNSNSTLPKLTKNNRVPVLDLDAIDDDSLISTSLCTSIRSSSSINGVRTTWAGIGTGGREKREVDTNTLVCTLQ